MKSSIFFSIFSVLIFWGCGQSPSTNKTKSDSTSTVKTTNKNPSDTFATVRKVLKSGIPKTKKQCFVLSESEVKHFLAEGKSIIEFNKFITTLQQYENEAATIFMLDASETWIDHKDVVTDLILNEKNLKQLVDKAPLEPRHEILRKSFSKFLANSIRNDENLFKYGPQSVEFNKSNDYSHEQFSKFYQLFNKSLGSKEFISIDSVKYFCLSDDFFLRKYDKQLEIDTLLKQQHPYAALLLLSKVEAEDSFQYDHLNMITADIMQNFNFTKELSQYIKVPNNPDYDVTTVGFNLYEELINSNRYSPYLYSLWRKWRTINQFLNYGSSNFSEIPNDIYDEKRFKLMEIILNHVKDNPEDTWAVVQFFYLADKEILMRNAGNQYGNTSLDERMVLF